MTVDVNIREIERELYDDYLDAHNSEYLQSFGNGTQSYFDSSA